GRVTAPVRPLLDTLSRLSLLVLIGDFLSPLPELHALVNGFAAAGQRGHLLQVMDPAEETLPFDGRIRFAGIEERDEILISRVESVREDYVRRLAVHREGIETIVRAVGWSFATHRTDRTPHAALLAL